MPTPVLLHSTFVYCYSAAAVARVLQTFGARRPFVWDTSLSFHFMPTMRKAPIRCQAAADKLWATSRAAAEAAAAAASGGSRPSSASMRGVRIARGCAETPMECLSLSKDFVVINKVMHKVRDGSCHLFFCYYDGWHRFASPRLASSRLETTHHAVRYISIQQYEVV